MELRPVQPSDLATVQEWADQEHLAEYFRRYPPKIDWASEPSFMQVVGLAYLAIDNKTPIGMAQLYVEDVKARVVNLGVLVDKRRANVKEASLELYKQLCDYIFIDSDFNKVNVRILKTRDKLADRLVGGMWKSDGVLRQSCMYRGQLVDEQLLSLLKSEYLEWKASL